MELLIPYWRNSIIKLKKKKKIYIYIYNSIFFNSEEVNLKKKSKYCIKSNPERDSLHNKDNKTFYELSII